MSEKQNELELLLKNALRGQYHAALGMLKDAVEKCPESLWLEGAPAYWRVAYHAVFFAHLYLAKDLKEFVRWEKMREGVQDLEKAFMPPYTREEILEYVTRCQAMIDEEVGKLDLTAREAGFYWYKMTKVEHQIMNVRHVQHHVSHLVARLKSAGAENVQWVAPTESACR